MLIEYALLEDRLLIWAISRDTSVAHTVDIPRADVIALVDRFVRLARTRSDSVAFVNNGRALRALLLDPITPALTGINELLIIPDKELHGVPFALLPATSADRFLIEDYTLRMVPGAAFVQPRVQPSFSPGSAILLAGDVSPGESVAELPPLPAAGPELEHIAQLYQQPVQLRGVAATPSALTGRFADIDILHFAGHARFMSDQPNRSYLVLAPDSPGDPGLLFAEQLAQSTLRSESLVILSACSSGTRTATRTGGLSGLAQAFIAAGAAGVVGSLWAVEDSGTERLLVAFHRALVSGAAPAAALRTAQLSLLRDGAVNPAVWGAFRYEGL